MHFGKMPGGGGPMPDPAAMAGMVQMMTALHSTVQRSVLENGGRGMNSEKRETLVTAIVSDVLIWLLTEMPTIAEAMGDLDDE